MATAAERQKAYRLRVRDKINRGFEVNMTAPIDALIEIEPPSTRDFKTITDAIEELHNAHAKPSTWRNRMRAEIARLKDCTIE